MEPRVVRANELKEYLTPERCHIYETWGLVSANDPSVSIARARVEPGVSTKTHHLEVVQEIYLIVKGKGVVELGEHPPMEVTEGDTVVIPEGTKQKITNNGQTDLVFFCICTPAFTESCYHNDEP